jgi:Cft2 family RNA processing exonuclease
LNYIDACQPTNLKKIFLVHGDEKNLLAMKESLFEKGIQQVEVPEMMNEYTL